MRLSPRTKTALLIAISTSLLLSSASAQEPPDATRPAEPGEKQLPASVPQSSIPMTSDTSRTNGKAIFTRFANDQKQIYTAPFQRRNLKWDVLFIACTGGLIAADKHITGSISHNDVSTSQAISNAGLYSTFAGTGIILVSGIVKNDDRATETGYLSFEAAANTLAVGAFTQVIAGRERPLEGQGNGRFWVDHNVDTSFFSLHSGMTWSMAGVIAHEYPRSWVRLLVYGTASTVSVTRVTGLKHFPSDVAVGGTVGYLIGQHIFHQHSKFLRFQRH